jgi:hypothetical protein
MCVNKNTHTHTCIHDRQERVRVNGPALVRAASTSAAGGSWREDVRMRRASESREVRQAVRPRDTNAHTHALSLSCHLSCMFLLQREHILSKRTHSMTHKVRASPTRGMGKNKG